MTIGGAVEPNMMPPAPAAAITILEGSNRNMDFCI
jgi:hypothetical protein